MIINLWSTPRTGSVWYSYYLQRKNIPSTLLSEMFNRYHMTLYYKISHNGRITNHHEYSQGAFYKSYYIENNNLKYKKVEEPRSRNTDQEEEYLISLIDQIDTSYTYIFHNHVFPISKDIMDILMHKGVNIFIYRKDKLAQIASYAIAYETKEFVRFKIAEDHNQKIEISNYEPIKDLINRIKIWESLPKTNIIAYEDIHFFEQAGMPLKQNANFRDKLSLNSIKNLENLLEKYYYSA